MGWSATPVPGYASIEMNWVNRSPRNQILDGLVTSVGILREFSAGEVFRTGLAQHIDVILNPFIGVTRRFTQDEMTEILKTNGGSA